MNTEALAYSDSYEGMRGNRGRIVLIVTAALVLLVVIFAPSTVVSITGQPLSVECGGLEADVCDESWRRWAGGAAGSATITWVAIEPIRGTCAEYTFGYWWPFFDPFAMHAQPLC